MSTPSPSSSEDLTSILAIAKDAALLAGNKLRSAMTCRIGAVATTAASIKSSSTDLVTETDEACEALVIELLRQRYPDHHIIGEEMSGADAKYELTDDPTWTIDPIDGTTNFVHRLSLTCVLIAYLEHKQPLVGVIYDPMADELFWAIKGGGAFYRQSNDGPEMPIHTSKTTSMTQAVVAMDAGYGRDEMTVDRYVAVQRAILLRQVRHVRVLGCCGLVMAYVACGRLDAGFEEGSWEHNTGPKIWDVAAGKLLVEEAGGVTRDLTTKSTTADQSLDIEQRSVFSAASFELADELMDIIHSVE